MNVEDFNRALAAVEAFYLRLNLVLGSRLNLANMQQERQDEQQP